MIEHSGVRFRVSPPAGQADERLLYVGDDPDGVPLEVMAVELSEVELLVIHAMPLRAKYQPHYLEAKRWQR